MIEYNKELVAAKVKRHFAPEDQEKVISILNSYGTGEERTQLAILKLSDGNLEKLNNYLEAAKNDWRDVLAWAEYPEEMASPTWRMDAIEVEKIRERDRQQYIDWLYD